MRPEKLLLVSAYILGAIVLGQPSSISKQRSLSHLPRRLARNALQELECGSNLTVTSSAGKLTSPGYPASYQSDLECRWLLSAARGNSIRLNIDDLNIEAYSNCSYDYLDIYQGATIDDPLLVRLCGNVKNYSIELNLTSVLLVFISDATYEEKGFQILYSLDGSAFNPTDVSCDQKLIGTNGTVKSPGYPESYLPSQDCTTVIEVPIGEVIFLNFQVLKLEFDDECIYDYVSVYDGPSEEFPKLGQFCSNPSMISLKSTDNTMLLHFHSDGILNENGFIASYSTQGFIGESGSVGACKWRRDENEGSIWSPEYPEKYPSNTRCRIELIAPENHYITVTFEELQLEPDRNCSYDFVEITEGFDKTFKVLGRLCTSHTIKPVIRSTGSRIIFSFHSDGFTEFKGFLAHYKFVKDPSCLQMQAKPDHLFETRPSFIQTSPNATVLQGKRHAISCIPRSHNSRIRWFKDNQFIGGTSLPKGLKLTDSTTLEVSAMEPEHVGRYTCAIAEPDPNRTALNATIWLAMAFNEEKCDIILREVPYDVVITERIQFKLLECSSPTPNVTISWEKDGIPIVPNDRIQMLPKGHLYMDKLLPSDHGFYTCVASKESCKKRASALVNIRRIQNVTEVCGLPKKGHPGKDKPKLDSGRIVGGIEAEKGAYPWQVMLWEPKNKAFCGAVILNERWVISAAHCFAAKLNSRIKWDEVVLRLGKHDLSMIEPQEFSTKIEEVLTHPSYNVNTFDNDLALIKLHDTVPFSDYIMPICLGESKTLEGIVFGEQIRLGTVTGWGKLTEKGGIPRHLREIKIPIVKKKQCIDSTNHLVTKNMFCAGYAQEIVGDACQGDSGGPFVVQHSGRWYLVGLVSWGEGCAKPGHYGFYTKVTNYHSWIKGVVDYSRR